MYNPVSSYFPKSGHSATQTEVKKNMNTRKVKRHRNPDTNNEALPGVLGNRGTKSFISWEKGNKGQIWRGTGEQRQYWGTGNIENKFSILGEQGNKPIYFSGTREQLPHGRASTKATENHNKTTAFEWSETNY